MIENLGFSEFLWYNSCGGFVMEEVFNEELKKRDNLLEQYNNLYIEYMDLVEKREEIKMKYANKNKKDIILNIFLLMVATSVMLFLVKHNLIELFELYPKICINIYNFIFALSLCYEGYMLFNRLIDANKIYDGLSDDEEYMMIIKNIKSKENELNKINDKVINFVNNDDISKNSYEIVGNECEDNYSLDINKNNLIRRRIKK